MCTMTTYVFSLQMPMLCTATNGSAQHGPKAATAADMDGLVDIDGFCNASAAI